MGVRVAHRRDDSIPVGAARVARAPDDAHVVARLADEETEAGADAAARRDHDDGREELGDGGHALVGPAAHVQRARRVRDHALRPVARRRHDDREAFFPVRPRDRRERVVLDHRPVRDADRAAQRRPEAREVQPDGVRGERLSLDGAAAQTRPRVDDEQRGGQQEPEGGRRDEDDAGLRLQLAAAEDGGGDELRPEEREDGPAGEAVRALEVVVVLLAQAGQREDYDGDEEGEQDGREDHEDWRGLAAADVLSDDYPGVDGVPDRRGR